MPNRAGKVVLATLHVGTAIALATASVVVQRSDTEVAAYGSEGSIEEQVRPRIVGGWPAPFLADSPATSVPCKLGMEDDLRLGALIADIALWYLLLEIVARLARMARRRARYAA